MVTYEASCVPLPHTFLCRTNPTSHVDVDTLFFSRRHPPATYPIQSPCRPPLSPPLPSQVMLRVGDLPRSSEWYERVLGMQLVRQRDNPEYK